jgi:glycosyltransferase involved in cell wall biosynthesis
MKVLFVCSGNNKKIGLAPFIRQQGESLVRKGMDVSYFPIVGRGISGYLKAAVDLAKHLRQNKFDLIHAHFVLSGWAAVLAAGRIPVVLSLMGDDAYGVYTGVNTVRLSSRFYTLLTWCIQPFVKAIISKSQNIENYVYLKSKSHIIPNGIDLQRFTGRTEFNKSDYFPANKRIILFLGNKAEIRKNYHLVKGAVELMKDPDVELVNPYPVKHADVPALLSMADVLAVPSLMEGSPNVVKEAMACNCPIVATDTGDVKWVVSGTSGCYVSSFNKHEFAAKLSLALQFAARTGRTDGARRIVNLGLNDECIATKVIEVYKGVLSGANILQVEG